MNFHVKERNNIIFVLYGNISGFGEKNLTPLKVKWLVPDLSCTF
jgi:hypothetical protein